MDNNGDDLIAMDDDDDDDRVGCMKADRIREQMLERGLVLSFLNDAWMSFNPRMRNWIACNRGKEKVLLPCTVVFVDDEFVFIFTSLVLPLLETAVEVVVGNEVFLFLFRFFLFLSSLVHSSSIFFIHEQKQQPPPPPPSPATPV